MVLRRRYLSTLGFRKLVFVGKTSLYKLLEGLDGVENIQGQFFGKSVKNIEKAQKIASSSTKGRASRAPFAGHFLYFFHIFAIFPKKLPWMFFTESIMEGRLHNSSMSLSAQELTYILFCTERVTYQELPQNNAKCSKTASSTKWGASRPIFAGLFLHIIFHYFGLFSEIF